MAIKFGNKEKIVQRNAAEALRKSVEVVNALDTEILKMIAANPTYAPPKVSITIRLDADLVERYRSSGSGWQTRLNADLRNVIT